MKNKPHVEFTEERQELAINGYRKYGVLIAAAQMSGVAKITIQKLMASNATFKKAMHAAKEDYVESLELILDKRIKDGSSKMGDTLLIFKLKKEVPAYRDKFEHTVDTNIKIITSAPRPKDKKKEGE